MKNINKNKLDWDLSLLLPDSSDVAVQKEKKEVKRQVMTFVNKWESREDYLKDPKILKEALDEYNDFFTNFGTGGRFGYYLWLRTKLDQSDPKIKAQQNKLHENSVRLSNELEFFTHRISKIPQEEQSKFLNDTHLEDYKHYLEGLFETAKYLLSEAEEKILNLTYKTSSVNWSKMVSDFISREEREVLTEEGKKETKTFSDFSSLLASRSKEVRDTSAEAINDVLDKHVDSAEAEINSVFEYAKMIRDIKNVERPDTFRHIADDIDPEVVDTLVEATVDRFDIPNRYYELKAKLLGLDKLEYHERVVDYGEVTKKYSYEEAVDLVGEVYEELDEEFLEIFRDYVENGKFDVYPKKGKFGGALCVHNLLTHPGYVLLNYTERLRDVTTIAHEMGHAINHELMRDKQKALNFGSPLSTAEVASTFMENFVLDRLLSGADDETKLVVMMAVLDDAMASVPRQIACYKFEWDLHEKFVKEGYLSKDTIGEIFQKNMSAYMGDFVDQSEGSQNWWVHWNHIRNFFYVYTYASGLLISMSLQNMVREAANDKEKAEIMGKIKDFLSVGTSEAPKETFLRLGIDISDKEFWNRGLDEIDRLLVETEELAKKLGKIN